MSIETHRWIKPTLINLNIVALIGVILRYKIAFSLPFIDQKHLLHGHSHFSFCGWISQALMVLMIEHLVRNGMHNAYKKYSKWLIINLICAYGMLVTFTVQGYGLFSITFSTLSIAVAFIFGVTYWKDLNLTNKQSVTTQWFKAAIFFNMLSSLGAFSLSMMMATHGINQNWYLASIYFFLHFQYNGWFFFVCMGLFTQFLIKMNVSPKAMKQVFNFFVFSCIPAYLLSALWLPFPKWVFLIVALAAVAQVIGWSVFVNEIFKKAQVIKQHISPFAKMILSVSAIALTVKLLLQLGSVYPPLSTLAFGFRPIVIGYLHLVLLGVISIFLIGYMVSENHLHINNATIAGIKIFISGVVLNEVVLMLQGMNALRYENLPYANEALIGAALIMFIGLFALNISQYLKQKTNLN